MGFLYLHQVNKSFQLKYSVFLTNEGHLKIQALFNILFKKIFPKCLSYPLLLTFRFLLIGSLNCNKESKTVILVMVKRQVYHTVLIGLITFDEILHIENTVDSMNNVDNIVFSFQMVLSKYLYVQSTLSFIYLNLQILKNSERIFPGENVTI